ncbi:zinc finger, CCHC-type containing protein [Tanacetum coccineum]
MANIRTCNKHNMIACVEKTAHNADFYQIIDYLTGCSINYSLLVDPDLIGPWLQQFWATASLRVINEVPHIRAMVAGKRVITGISSREAHCEEYSILGLESSLEWMLKVPYSKCCSKGKYSTREVRRLKKQNISQAKQIYKLKAKLKKLSKGVKPLVKHHILWVKSQKLKKRGKKQKKKVFSVKLGRNKNEGNLSEEHHDQDDHNHTTFVYDCNVITRKHTRIYAMSNDFNTTRLAFAAICKNGGVTDSADVMMAMGDEELLGLIMDSGGSYHITYKRDYLVDFEKYDGGNILLGDGRECRVRGTYKVQVKMEDGSSFMLDNSGKIKVIKGSLVVLSGTRRANCVYTLDGQAVTKKTLKGRKQLGEYQTGWKIKKNVLDSRNQRSTQQCMKSGVAKHLGVTGLQQQNGLVEGTDMTLLDKVHCFLIQSGLPKVFWSEDTTMSTYLLNRNMVFNESGEYKKTFIGSGVGSTNSRFDILSFSTCDREQHLAWELFSYIEDSNEAAFAVAAVDKIYVHELLTFNNTVACEVIPKWKARLKDDTDTRSDVYVISNGCRKCSDDSDGYYWEYTPGMFIHLFLYIDGMVFSCGCKAEIWATKGFLDKAKGNVFGMKIVRDQSGNTLKVS